MNLLAPLYLAALAALALPWLLHRFNDAEPERRAFPSTRFLEPTAPPVSRRRRLRHLLLLALRVLVVAALALLFADPWIPRPDALADARELHVVAVDTSLSMRAGERFARALDAAGEALDAVPAGDPVTVLAFDREVRLASDEAVPSAEGRKALERLAPGFASADYGRLMQRLDRLADESALPVRATLVTDAQRSSLPVRRNALYAPRLLALELVDVGADEANVALAAEATSGNGAQARVRVTLVASASGASGDAAFDRVVVLSRDGDTVARRAVRLAPGARETVVFESVTLPEAPGARLDVAFATPDALVEDDATSIPVRLDGARRIALAALEARPPDAARVFVTTALEADGAATVDASALATGQLPEDARRVVAFAPLGDADALPAVLLRHVARGGAALVVDAGRREGIVADANEEVPDGEGGTIAADSVRGSGVGRVDDSHPLALGDIFWGDVRFYANGAYEPGENDRVLIETVERRPVLIERPSENGSLLVLNERLDGNDSNLPFQPAFVALVAHVGEWFDAGRSVPERVTVGDALSLPLNVQVIDPDGRPLLALGDASDAGPLTLERPGLYTVAGPLGDQTLAVTIDPRESDLATLAADELAAWSGRHAAGGDVGALAGVGTGEESGEAAATGNGTDESASVVASSPVSTAPVASARERAARLPLWPFLLPLLAVLLLVETLHANRRLDVRRDGT